MSDRRGGIECHQTLDIERKHAHLLDFQATGLARNTVKKYLRSDETEPTYAKRVNSSKLDPYAEKLATWLGMDATKSRRQRRNLKQIYTGL